MKSLKHEHAHHPKSPSAAAALGHDATRRERTFNVLGNTMEVDGTNVYRQMAAKGYAIQYVIGKGSYGAVYGGTKKEGNVLIPTAMKLIGGFNKKRKWHYRLGRYVTEMKVMSRLKHPNLVEVLDIFLEGNTKGRNWERRCFIWMERAKTDLGKMFLEAPGFRLPEGQVRVLMSHAMNGLLFLHDQRIAHRDLKPWNILVFDSEQGEIAKVTDYSLIGETGHDTITRSVACTPGYRSPSTILRQYNPFKLDVWSMGIIIFQLLVGRFPAWTEDNVKNQETMLHEFGLLQADVNACFGQHPQLLNLLRDKMLTMRDEDRATVKEAIAHPWFPDVTGHPIYRQKGAVKGFNDPSTPPSA